MLARVLILLVHHTLHVLIFVPQELRQMEMQMTRPGMGPRATTMIGNDIAPAQLKAEHILLKRKNQLLLKKEKRIQVSFSFLLSFRMIRKGFKLDHQEWWGKWAWTQTVIRFTERLFAQTFTRVFPCEFSPARVSLRNSTSIIIKKLSFLDR